VSSHFVAVAAAVVVCWYVCRTCKNRCKWNT